MTFNSVFPTAKLKLRRQWRHLASFRAGPPQGSRRNGTEWNGMERGWWSLVCALLCWWWWRLLLFLGADATSAPRNRRVTRRREEDEMIHASEGGGRRRRRRSAVVGREEIYRPVSRVASRSGGDLNGEKKREKNKTRKWRCLFLFLGPVLQWPIKMPLLVFFFFFFFSPRRRLWIKRRRGKNP